jgi:DNA primase
LKQELYKVNKLQKKAMDRDNLSERWNNSIDNSRHMTVKPLLPAYINAEKFLLSLMMQSVEITDLVRERIGADFIKEEHAALAAHLYGYYEAGYEPDVAKFVSYLQDSALMEQATKLAMIPIDVQTTSQKEIEDYIHQIHAYPIRLQIETLEQEKKKQEKLGNSLDAARIGMEILQLQKNLKK